VEVDHPQFQVYTWGDRRRMLGALDVAFPKRNGACRDFGFYIAWKESDDDEIIVALDDDCIVYHDDFAERAAQALSDRPRPVAITDGVHLNVLDLYADVPDNLFPRGFPYSARPGYQRCTFPEAEACPVTFSLGLWKGVFDINAIDKLQGPPWCHAEAELRYESVVIPENRLISVCSMNMLCRREVLPAVYQLPMHVEVLPGWVIDRYGDIWGGFILKTLMDLRGAAMAAGGPLIHHVKEGNYQRNIWQEHVCHLVNDEFLEILARAKDRIAPAGYVEMMGALNEEFHRATARCSPLLKPYFEHLTTALGAWVSALQG
jgi:hypothetical protein